jgi:hypothetical protein
MKINQVKIIFDDEIFYVGKILYGRVLVQPSCIESWLTNGKMLIKLYDNLNIEWLSNEDIGGSLMYTNKKKPFQLDIQNLVNSSSFKQLDEGYFVYNFEYKLPENLQGSINVTHAKCQYYIKCYLSSNCEITKHYATNVNVFTNNFKILDQFVCKKEVLIQHEPILSHDLSFNQELIYEAKSNNFKVTATLPKVEFHKNEMFKLQLFIENNNSIKEFYKISFKLIQSVKLISILPTAKSKLFENLIVHTSKRYIKQNINNVFLINELIQIPEQIPNTTSKSLLKSVNIKGTQHPNNILITALLSQLNPIRISYKLSIEFWENIFNSDLDLNIPFSIDPEI